MSHYAKVLDGKVIQIIVANSDFFNTFTDTSAGAWLQTSYNTRGGVHYGQDGQADGKEPLRGNYAGIGFTYDQVNDVFYAPQPFPSWTISAPTWTWEAPIPCPTDNKMYSWDEPTTSWALIE
jgi:hypothetical protein